MLDQTGADDHVHYVYIIAHAAGNAGEDNVLHVEVVQQGGGASGGHDLADAGLDHDYVLTIQGPQVEGLAAKGDFLLHLGRFHQRVQLYAHGADNGGAGSGVLLDLHLGGREALLRGGDGIHHAHHHVGGSVGGLGVVEGVSIVGDAVGLVGHAAEHRAGYAVLVAHPGYRRALHLAGQSIELVLKLFDIALAGDELVTGGDDALVDLLFAQHLAGGRIGELGKGLVHGDHAGFRVFGGFAVPLKAVIGFRAVVVLDQTGADDHVHHVYIVPHAAGNAGEDNAAYAVVVDQRLGAGSCQHLSDTGPHQYNVHPVEGPGVEGAAGYGLLFGDLGFLYQLLQFYIHGADDAEGARFGFALTGECRCRSQGYRQKHCQKERADLFPCLSHFCCLPKLFVCCAPGDCLLHLLLLPASSGRLDSF